MNIMSAGFILGNAPEPKWYLLGAQCGVESILKYESMERPGLMKEVNSVPGRRIVVFYWEDAKGTYNSLKEALEAREVVCSRKA
jgi:hypothetical protein